MVRIDTLHRSLLALVPALALTTVACTGNVESGEDTTEPRATEQTADMASDDPQNPLPGNAGISGSEASDEGYAAALAQDGQAREFDGSADEPGSDVAQSSDALLSTRGTTFVNEMRRENDFLNKSTSYYSHTTYMNESTGTRRTDCSGFVGYALNRVLPDAYAKVPHPDTYKPLADDWYNYLSTRYTTASTQSTPRWRKIVKAMDLKPGDVVVWLTPDNVTSENTGHIMIVNGYPKAGRSDKNEVLVPIIDSTTAPHANDSRGTTMTGVGSGTIGLKVDSYGKPTGYYWRGGLSYNSYATKIALGRVE